jgi:hypothetical protein
MVSLMVQCINDFRCEFDSCGHTYHHTRLNPSVKPKPQLVPVSSIVIALLGSAVSPEFARFVIEKEQTGRRLGLDDSLILNEIQREWRIDLAWAIEITCLPPGNQNQLIYGWFFSSLST